MYKGYFVWLFLVFACNPSATDQHNGNIADGSADSTNVEAPGQDTSLTNPDSNVNPKDTHIPGPDQPKRYANFRFKDVTVEKTGEHRFTIKGKGQIFEATFGWVVEDGHNELLKGFDMTDAGAPEWGNFTFSIEVKKQRPNSTLMLILYEESAKDGSRQYELPVLLE